MEVLVAVARLGSVTRAAGALAMSQSAASAALMELERGYGVQLFDRIGKRLRLNDLGKAVVPRVTELLDNLGAIHLFRMTTGALQLPDDVKTCTPESVNPSHEQITRTSLEAHQTLMAMSPENLARFKDVAQFLAEDLKSLEKSS